MEFEMDIPAAEELEWLESNSLLLEFEEEGEEYIVVEDEEVAGSKQSNLTKSQDPAPSHENETQRKRVRSEEEEGDGASRKTIQNEEERGNKRRELDEDEDWLRYSPPPQPQEATADVASESDHPMPEEVAEEKIISRFISEINGDCMPVTGPGGDRVYAKMSSGEAVGGQRMLHRENSANGLLSDPIQALINGVEQEVLKKVLQESFASPSQTKHSTMPLVTEQLWVDKYAPNSFTDLLSDEQTNREVLLWLKQWDSCVFGSQIRATTEDVFLALSLHSSAQHQKLSDNNKSFFNKNQAASFINHNLKSSDIIDKENNNMHGVSELRSKKNTVDCHPEQKVLLLCGPPGLGKTTLAHVAAKHCGYRVVEINASDERSSSTIESRILDVVQMNSVMADSKPKCLVIDEIDGALGEGKGAVDVILKMVAAGKKSSVQKGNSSQEDQPGKAPLKKAKQRSATLLRPVICICNDLYAPALRSLRQVAKVHMFVQPTTSRVVNRLKYICKKEGFKTSSIALSTLTEFTECDIRSCLNTLQFLNKKKEALNLLEVDSQVVGRKDMSRSAFDVWKEIFQKRKSKRGRNTKSISSDYADFNFLYSLISNRGEYELTMDGIYENFLHLSYHDPMMQKTVRCLDTLGVSDSMHQYILRTQRMSLYAYQPPIAIIMRNLIAQFEKPNIEWPKSLQKCRAMLRERKDTIKFWHNKISRFSPSISRHLSVEYFVEDLISPLLHIISPTTLRPVALHLLTEREKNDLSQLVDTMVSYSITYKSSKPEHLQKFHNHGAVSDVLELSFDPPIDEFVRFQSYQSEHFGLSLAVKQVLVHEVEKQRILRESIGKSTNHYEGISSTSQASLRADKLTTNMTSAEGSSQLKTAFSKGQSDASTSLNSFSETKKSFPANGMSSLAPENVKKPIRNSSSFFDRFRKGNSKGSRSPGEVLQKAATIERDSRPFLFKYNEGFTNAVKRPVKIRELLL